MHNGCHRPCFGCLESIVEHVDLLAVEDQFVHAVTGIPGPMMVGLLGRGSWYPTSNLSGGVFLHDEEIINNNNDVCLSTETSLGSPSSCLFLVWKCWNSVSSPLRCLVMTPYNVV